MPFLPFVILSLLLLALIPHLLQCPFLLLARVRIEEIVIFYGKPLATLRLGTTLVKLGWIPGGFSTKYDVDEFARRPLPLRVALILIPPLLILATGFALLGPDRGWHQLLTGFRQYFEGPLHPQAVGGPLVAKLDALYRSSPLDALGVLAMKLAALALLPFGPTAGMAVMEFIPRHRRENRGPQMFLIAGTLLVLLCNLVWAALLVIHALKA